jgi:hypothetical protein
VKQADLVVGGEYAYPTYGPYDAAPAAACVRIVSIDGNGAVTVTVVDPGPEPRTSWNVRAVKRNEKLQVKTRQLACQWDEWPDRAASIGAEKADEAARRHAEQEKQDRERADRVTLAPHRPVPAAYDEDDYYYLAEEEREALVAAYTAAPGPGRHAIGDALTPMLEDLPVLALRDLLAAGILSYSDERRPGTVASTFMRAARLLRSPWSDAGPRPDVLLSESDTAFVNAICEHIAAAGGELLLPPVPPLPDWVREQKRAFAPVFGWLRLAAGDTTGRRLHATDCRSLRSQPTLLADHLPWWMVMLEDPDRLCGRCGGPGVRDVAAMASFAAAAADVWDARGRDRIERWQQAAFQRLVSEACKARAQALEPDITLAWRITAALAEDAPGQEGWAAYALVVGTRWKRLNEELSGLTPRQVEAARVLAHGRLETLEAAIPASQRPVPLSRTADAKTMYQRYEYLKDLLKGIVPQIDRLLFTLPGAYQA